MDPSDPNTALVYEMVLMHEMEKSIRTNFFTTVCMKFRASVYVQRQVDFVRRKCNEMIAKWILCQKAREMLSMGPGDTPAGNFFPRRTETYDDQLVRDITMLFDFNSREQVDIVKKFITEYNLGARCRKQHETVLKKSKTATIVKLNLLCDQENVSTKIDNETSTIHGPCAVVECGVQCGASLIETSIPVPRVVYEKMHRAYRIYGFPDEDAFLFRFTTVLLRYLRSLASGSVQLCADTELKQKLCRDEGYSVCDLCASPINAFCNFELDPTHFFFCSAFPELDCHFGSMCSIFDPNLSRILIQRIQEARAPNSKWIFTLDIPYDEDFAECFFGQCYFEDSIALPLREEFCDKTICFVAVIPHWWDLRFDSFARVGPPAPDVSMYVKLGYEVPCTWVGSFRQCCDVAYHAYIPKERYTYYSSESNEKMSGVTDTEIFIVEIINRTTPTRPLAQIYAEIYT
eukprot:PhF_6_TR5635/c0_g2_i1/m.8211